MPEQPSIAWARVPARACALSAAPQLQPASLRRRDQHGAARATPCVAAWLPRSASEACLHCGGLALCGGLVARALGALAVKTRQEADSSSRAAAASVPASARAPRQLGSVSFSIRARGGGASGRASSRQMSWDDSLGCPLWCDCPNSSEQRGRAQWIAYDHPIAHPQRDTRRSWARVLMRSRRRILRRVDVAPRGRAHVWWGDATALARM